MAGASLTLVFGHRYLRSEHPDRIWYATLELITAIGHEPLFHTALLVPSKDVMADGGYRKFAPWTDCC